MIDIEDLHASIQGLFNGRIKLSNALYRTRAQRDMYKEMYEKEKKRAEDYKNKCKTLRTELFQLKQKKN